MPTGVFHDAYSIHDKQGRLNTSANLSVHISTWYLSGISRGSEQVSSFSVLLPFFRVTALMRSRVKLRCTRRTQNWILVGMFHLLKKKRIKAHERETEALHRIFIGFFFCNSTADVLERGSIFPPSINLLRAPLFYNWLCEPVLGLANACCKDWTQRGKRKCCFASKETDQGNWTSRADRSLIHHLIS